jgi:hypothetical protein
LTVEDTPVTPSQETPPEVTVDSRRAAARGGEEKLYIFLRYGLALFLLLYGFSKLFGAQFTVLDSELDKRLGRVSGFWLTWYYFSYSKIYGSLIAVIQIAGAVLLMFRKTTLLGACVLLPLLVNVALIDLFYGIDLDATLIAVVLLGGLLLLLARHKEELLDIFWRGQNRLFPEAAATLPRELGKWALRMAMIIGAAVFTYWVANYNNRAPTPIDGVWRVVRVEPASEAQGLPATIFFERNRAHLCVFKFNEYSYQWHHFEVDPRTHTIEFWQEWLKKGRSIFSGHYELFRDRLTLSGGFLDGAGEVTLSLERID